MVFFTDGQRDDPLWQNHRSNITAGLPQRSIIGSLLFKIFIYDLVISSKDKRPNYADGKTLRASSYNLVEVKKCLEQQPTNCLSVECV